MQDMVSGDSSQAKSELSIRNKFFPLKVDLALNSTLLKVALSKNCRKNMEMYRYTLTGRTTHTLSRLCSLNLVGWLFWV